MVEPQVGITALKAWLAIDAESHQDNVFAEDHERPPTLPNGDDISLCQFVRLTEEIAGRLKDPLMGWSVGLGFDLSSLNEMGDAILSSRCLGGALQRMVDYFSIIQDAADVRLAVDIDDAVLSYRILDPGIWPRRQDALFTLGIFAKIIRSAIGSTWSTVEIVLECDGSGIRKEAPKTFGAACQFNGDTNMIRFPAHLLDNSLGALAQQRLPNHARLSQIGRAHV